MKRLATAVMLTALLAATAAAQQATAPQIKPLFTGTVSGDRVYVRSGPGQTAYPCTVVTRGTQVQVVEVSGGWLKILPVAGCYSVVSKTDVVLDPERGIAVVTADHAWIRPGGDLVQEEFPGVQGRVGRNTRLQVIGQTTNFYKIRPPLGAYFWITADLVARPSGTTGTPGETPPVTLTPPRAETTAPPRETTPRTPAPLDANAPAAQPPIAPESPAPTTRPAPAPVDPAAQKLQEAEAALQAEYAKPPEQRNLQGLLDTYQAITLPPDSPLAPYVQHRVDFLQAALAQRKESQEVEKLLEATRAKQRELELARTRIEVRTATVEPTPQHEAKGIVMTSRLYRDYHALYNPDTRTIIAYLRPADPAIDLARHVDQRVGVFGQKRYSERLKDDVITVERVEVLDETPRVPATPGPRVIIRPPLPPAPRDEAPAPRGQAPASPQSSAPAAESDPAPPPAVAGDEESAFEPPDNPLPRTAPAAVPAPREVEPVGPTEPIELQEPAEIEEPAPPASTTSVEITPPPGENATDLEPVIEVAPAAPRTPEPVEAPTTAPADESQSAAPDASERVQVTVVSPDSSGKLTLREGGWGPPPEWTQVNGGDVPLPEPAPLVVGPDPAPVAPAPRPVVAAVDSQPLPEPAAAPAVPAPAVLPAPAVVVEPAPATQPAQETTNPTSPMKLLELLPGTGLPVAPDTSPAVDPVNETEYR